MILSLFQQSLNSFTKNIKKILYDCAINKKESKWISKELNRLKLIPKHLLKLILIKFEPFYLDLIDEYKLETNQIWKYYLIKLNNQLINISNDDAKSIYFEILINLWLKLSLNEGKRDHEIIFNLLFLTENISLKRPQMSIHPKSKIYEYIYKRITNSMKLNVFNQVEINQRLISLSVIIN